MEFLPDEFFDLATLNTVAGAALAVYLVVRFTKPIFKSRVPAWMVRVWVLVLSWAVLAFARISTGDVDRTTLGLILLDGFIVAFAAMGLHETVSDPKALKMRVQPPYRK